MHNPKAFQELDEQKLRDLVGTYPLATLVVQTTGGLLVNHIPLLWNGTQLHGHIARNNELVPALNDKLPSTQKSCAATAIFNGPNGYISPGDYPSKAETGKVVPTWNYAVVHIEGALELRDDAAFIRQQIDELTAHQEQPLNQASPWTLDDAPPDFAEALQRSIVGIALSIESISGKFKLSQNRPERDRLGAQQGAEARGDTALARLMVSVDAESSRPQQT